MNLIAHVTDYECHCCIWSNSIYAEIEPSSNIAHWVSSNLKIKLYEQKYTVLSPLLDTESKLPDSKSEEKVTEPIVKIFWWGFLLSIRFECEIENSYKRLIINIIIIEQVFSCCFKSISLFQVLQVVLVIKHWTAPSRN